MENIRCLIAEIPQKVLADIVQSIAEESENIEVVERISKIEELPFVLKKQKIDVLILGMKNFIFPQICKEMLEKFSNLLIVGLVDDGRMASVYLDNVGSQEIVNIINILGKR